MLAARRRSPGERRAFQRFAGLKAAPAHAGATHPFFRTEQTNERATLTSGALSFDVLKGDGWQLTFREGYRLLNRSDWRSLAYVQCADQGDFAHETLQVGESVYGPGERCTARVMNVQVVDTPTRTAAPLASRLARALPPTLTTS
ncbi:MAG: hypothetical protein ABJD97_08775 [Betaproteobacteria bacterium]